MAIETNELIDVKTLSPFKKFIMTIGNLPTSYLESMTYAELLMWFCNYLQETVIPTVNNNAEAVEELQDFVTEYFDNLDVTEEIENKLDKMAEDGTLTNLIKNYVDPLYTTYENQINATVGAIQTQVNAVASGSPLVATSTSGMTDTDRVYVNTTDGKWYYYDGDSWEIGGTYQSTGLDSNSVIQDNLVGDLKTSINTRNVTPTWIDGKLRSSSGTIANQSNNYVSEPIQVYAGETIYFKAKAAGTNTMICLVNDDNTRLNNNGTIACAVLSTSTSMSLYSYEAKQDLLISLNYYQEYEYFYISTKNKINDPINTMKYAIDYKKPEFTLTQGKYISNNGIVNTLSAFDYTSPIALKKDETISFEGQGVANTVSVITLCDENGQNLVPTVISDVATKKHYSYTALSDCYVILCSMCVPFENIVIYKNKQNETKNLFNTLLTVGVIGDSLANGVTAYSSGGSTELVNLPDYSWPQFMSKLTGNTYYNFAWGGLSTRTWLTDSHGASLAFDGNHTCTGYIIGLGVNDAYSLGIGYLGLTSDIDLSDYHNNSDTFYGNYARIIQMIKEEQPNAKIFILTMPITGEVYASFNNAIRYMATIFDNVYLIDLYKYYLEEFTSGFIDSNKTSSHYNAIAYQYIADLFYNILNNYMMTNYTEFKDVQFIGTNYSI